MGIVAAPGGAAAEQHLCAKCGVEIGTEGHAHVHGEGHGDGPTPPKDDKPKLTPVEEMEKKMAEATVAIKAGKATAAGNRVIFDSDGSYIENKASGEKTWLKEKGGMYVLRLWVRNPF